MRSRSIAILSDFKEEGWPSMDLCGEMLLENMPASGPFALKAERECPRFRHVATGLPRLGRHRSAFNADRLINRFAVFPRHARKIARKYDFFHVVDHTYAQLVTALPSGRAGVYCHDLDAFRCLLDPVADPRPRWFRAMASRILRGLKRAAIVFYSNPSVRDEIERLGLIDPDRMVFAPYGVSSEFRPDDPALRAEMPELHPIRDRPFILHVGSCIPRKRIDVLLDVFAEIRKEHPETRLVKVGGEWDAEQRDRIRRLNLEADIVHLTGLTRPRLAEVYRRAGLVLVPSEAEGFGLPVIEALACGTRVIASDIPALREAGGSAAMYCPVGDVAAWSRHASALLADPSRGPDMPTRLAWSGRFTWKSHAEIIAQSYRRLL